MAKRNWGLVAAGAMLGSAALAAPVPVSFTEGSAAVAALALNDAAVTAARHGHVELMIVGQASGTMQRFDPKLSDRRAAQLRAQMALLGVPAERIEISYGPGSGI